MIRTRPNERVSILQRPLIGVELHRGSSYLAAPKGPLLIIPKLRSDSQGQLVPPRQSFVQRIIVRRHRMPGMSERVSMTNHVRVVKVGS